MKAGARDRLLTFWRNAQVKDAMGGLTDNWVEVGSAWAERLDISDAERWQAAQVQALISTRFRVLRSIVTVELTPMDRITLGGRTHDIQGIKELGREGLEITCNARADQ